ncbi:unnamed protein product [Adineta steineri]|uniref:VCBS repeat-containing protein n=1 Tax=Adineta steineri TaxID=433720 RepID=A0A816DHZ5_9BILA|nr:unnamed protein product [Adineta steineri]CAF1637493.1 unnamed protein product [Adineta steineri]
MASTTMPISTAFASTEQFTFERVVAYPSGNGFPTTSITTADVNGDNKQDIVGICGSDNNVAVILGYGNGSFGTPTMYLTGSRIPPTLIIVVDINGDKYPDIVVADPGWANVLLFFGYGNGSFQERIILYMGDPSGPISLAVDDLNGDSYPDIAVANVGSGQVVVMLNYGNGSFQAPYAVGGCRDLFSVALGDFDGDSCVDIAIVCNWSYEIMTYFGNCDGTFGQEITFGVPGFPLSLTAADFNNDNYLDIAVANIAGGHISVVLGNANRASISRHDYSTGDNDPVAIAVGDLNGDSYLDMAVAYIFRDGNMMVFPGSGDGTFGEIISLSLEFYNGGNSIAVSDLNGDSCLDIIVGTGSYLDILFNTC